MVKSVTIVSIVKYVAIVCEKFYMVKYVTIVCMVESVTIVCKRLNFYVVYFYVYVSRLSYGRFKDFEVIFTKVKFVIFI